MVIEGPIWTRFGFATLIQIFLTPKDSQLPKCESIIKVLELIRSVKICSFAFFHTCRSVFESQNILSYLSTHFSCHTSTLVVNPKLRS
jgi:hypothetical protein